MTQNKTRVINKDFIGVVSTDDHGFFYHQIEIENPYREMLKRIEEMCDKEGIDVFCMQETFNRTIPTGPYHKYFDYLYPNSYDVPYVGGVEYPTLKEETYREELEKQKDDNERKAFIKGRKTAFYLWVERYVSALCFYKTLREIKHDYSNKMHSTETVGWKGEFECPISDDINVALRTNFGYGNSAYMYVNIRYKGISICPFSEIVKYRYADMVDFIRYTRQYWPKRRNWEDAMKFVVETANLAKNDAKAFEEKWIAEELRKMMSSLERMKLTPMSVMQEYVHAKQEYASTGCISTLKYVRNIGVDEKREYVVYPHEMAMAMQAEKITEASRLLDKIKELTSIYSLAMDYISRIEQLNSDMLPIFKRNRESIKRDIEEREQEQEKEKKELESLKAQLAIHEKAIEEAINTREEGTTAYSVRCEYREQHPEFVSLEKEKIKIEIKIRSISVDIYKREQFAESILVYINRCAKHFEKAGINK